MKATKSRKSEDGEETEVEIAEVMLSELDVDPSYVEALENAGLTMVSQLKGLSAEDLQYIEGLGEEGAAQVFDAVKEA
jgi:hypothetical protein